jgi:hypothetical protein
MNTIERHLEQNECVSKPSDEMLRKLNLNRPSSCPISLRFILMLFPTPAMAQATRRKYLTTGARVQSQTNPRGVSPQVRRIGT